MKIKMIFLMAFMQFANAFAQNVNNVQLPELRRDRSRQEIAIPDILGYKTLKCDLHIHTMFSDGDVWPTVRVDEAWSEGLDVIAITEHIENNPSKKYVSGDKNAPYEIALPRAQEKGIMLIKAGEITRRMPLGHLNALFLDDVNPLDVKDSIAALHAAKKQNAFILWNHPGWRAQQPDTCMWHDLHETLYKGGLMHGIEVFNECEWYPIALDWCLAKNLAPIANSDIHGVAEYYYDYNKYFRPMTLVLASDKTQDAVKDALMKGRTIAFFANKLAGKKEYLEALFKASVSVAKINNGKTQLTNHSDIPFYIEGDINVILKPHKTTLVNKTKAVIKISNLYIGSTQNLTLNIESLYKE